jgi:2,5-furandicarboxylate decarboxylase 1
MTAARASSEDMPAAIARAAPDDKDLRGFLKRLSQDEHEQIVRISREVTPNLELAAVVKRFETTGNPILWFDRVTGATTMPVVFGVSATKERIARALDQPVQRCVDWVLDRLQRPVAPVRAATVPVQNVIRTGDDARLDLLPLAIHSPLDKGPYLTVGVTTVRDPMTGNYNTGIYRIMVLDNTHVTLNSSLPHDLAKVLVNGAQRGVPVEFVIAIGHHPAFVASSQAKNPMTVDAYAVAGAFLGDPLAITPAVSVDLDVPADAEVIVEGRVIPGERIPEGPFGEFTYYYGAASGYVAEITAITHRRDAVFQDLHPAHIEHRCLWLFPGREARLLATLRDAVPTVKAVHIPLHGAGMSAYISLAKTHDGDATRALMVALSSDNYLKHVTIVDDDIDIFDDRQVLWALNVRFQGDRDLVLVNNCRGIRMDPSAYSLTDRNRPGALTTKLGFDATLPLERDRPPRADELPSPYENINLDDYVPRPAEGSSS